MGELGWEDEAVSNLACHLSTDKVTAFHKTNSGSVMCNGRVTFLVYCQTELGLCVQNIKSPAPQCGIRKHVVREWCQSKPYVWAERPCVHLFRWASPPPRFPRWERLPGAQQLCLHSDVYCLQSKSRADSFTCLSCLRSR